MNQTMLNALRGAHGESRLAPFLAALIAALFLAGICRCGERPIQTFSDLNGRPVGVLVGTIFDVAAEKHIDYAKIMYYDVYSEMEADLVAGGIDAIIGDRVVVAQIAEMNPKLRVLDENLEESDFGFALRYGDNTLFESVNGALGEMKRDGTLARVTRKWLDGPEEEKVMPPRGPDGGDGPVLRVGTCSVWPPFTYKGQDGSVIGLDIEMVLDIGDAIGRRVEIVDMEFGELIPSLISAEVDMVAASLTVTPERKRVVRFTDGYFRTGISALVRDERE